MHSRVSVSAICTYRWTVAEDLAFWSRHGIDRVGISVAKLEKHGWDDGVARIADAIAGGLDVGNLIGLGPFRLTEPAGWDEQRARLVRALDAAVAFEAKCMVCTTGPAGALPWDEAADAFADAMKPVIGEAKTRSMRIALEHTNSLRVDVGFVHTLRDAIDLASRLGIDVCMEVNACWAERALAQTITAGVERIALVQLSDYAIGTLTTPARLVPGDGDIPIGRIVDTLLAAGYEGSFDLELIGPRIEEEGYEAAIPRAVAAVERLMPT